MAIRNDTINLELSYKGSYFFRKDKIVGLNIFADKMTNLSASINSQQLPDVEQKLNFEWYINQRNESEPSVRVMETIGCPIANALSLRVHIIIIRLFKDPPSASFENSRFGSTPMSMQVILTRPEFRSGETYVLKISQENQLFYGKFEQKELFSVEYFLNDTAEIRSEVSPSEEQTSPDVEEPKTKKQRTHPTKPLGEVTSSFALFPF